LWAFLLAVGVARVAAVTTQNVNWDEFLLLQRVVISVRRGEVLGGGRPGLGTLLLMPFAAGCRNAVDTLVQARVVWTGMVVAAAVAFWFVLRNVVPPSPHRPMALLTGLALWVLAPPFLQASNQVRTDQPAILFGLLGGLALLASRKAVWWAPVAGLLFAAGFAFSQQLLYVGTFVTVLAVGQLAMRGDWRPSRDIGRAAIVGVTCLTLLLVYRTAMDRFGGAPAMLPVAGQLTFFEFYREYFGWRLYKGMLPYLVPQLLVTACLIPATIPWLRGRSPYRPEILTAWAVLVVGIAILLFHAGRLPYFWMVLGLFPAAVGALILVPMLHHLRSHLAQGVFLTCIWLPLAALALGQAASMTVQRQAHQRESIEFVERSFPPDAHGFEGHTAFTCRDDPAPFPPMFAHTIVAEFGGEDRSQRAREFIARFREVPASFLVLPVGQQYPQEVWDFWRTRYVHYYSTVHVPGRAIVGVAGWRDSMEVIVPGEYVWRTDAAGGPTLHVGTHVLESSQTVRLKRGYQALRLSEGGEGMLVLALPEPPAPGTTQFYIGR
jgi:hypothetical protein